MYNTIKMYEKIDLLLLSIQSINLHEYNSNKLRLLLAKNIDNKAYNIFNLSIYIQSYQSQTKVINIINNIYSLITKFDLQKTTIKILQGYKRKNHSIITQQYLRKYKYLYQKKQDYYGIINSYTHIDIEEKAILHLYIILQIYHHGFYCLVKYVYNYR